MIGSAFRRFSLAALCLALVSTPGALAGSTSVTEMFNTSFGAGIQYSDVYYHKGLAYIGSWTGPGRVFIADAETGDPVGTYSTSNASIIRDLQVQGDTLWVALDAGGIDIVDVSNPAVPTRVTFFPTTSSGVHDLFIHGNTLYYVDDISSSDLHIVNVTNRAAPVALTTWNNPGGCHDLTVVGNRAYLANLGGGFQILDVTNPAQPLAIATQNYANSFTHNIWPNGDGRYVATTDEICGTGHLRIWSVENPANVFQVGEYAVPLQGDTCVHNAMWIDNYIYLSYYTHGMRVVDATDPSQLVEVGMFETHTHAEKHDDLGGCFDGAWGVYAERGGSNTTHVFISDIGSGLWGFEFAGAANLALDGVGAYDAATGAFFLRDAAAPGGADTVVTFGAGGGSRIGLSGDWDGDGKKTIGLYDSATGTFFLKNSNAPGAADLAFTFGGGGQLKPIVGDWDGNDTETVGLYDPATGAFFLKNTNAPGAADLVFTFGPGGGAIPVVGDWDNSDADSIGIYVPSTGNFFLSNRNAPGAADIVVGFGPSGALTPLAGNWDGVGGDSIGLYDPATGSFFVKNANEPGPADAAFGFGAPGMTPLSGDWRGPGA
jgi:hypothetical protein